jgi:UDP-glucose 4-epimerase
VGGSAFKHEYLRMKRYLVTGGAGFIGSNLADHLLSLGHAVRVLDDLSSGKRSNLQPGIELVEGNAADPETAFTAARGCDGVFHLAAIASVTKSLEERVPVHVVNQTATVACLDAAQRHGGIPLVFASSAAIYGDQQPCVETLKPAPLSPYGADKAGSELHLLAGWHSFGQPSAALRFFNVFGPRQDPASPYSGVISAFLGRATAGQPLSIHGDGLQTRDFIFVADVVRHLAAAMSKLQEKPAQFTCNVCTGRSASIRELAETISKIVGGVEIGHGPGRAGDIRHSLGDPTLARSLLGVAAQVSLQDGLSATRDWLVQDTAAHRK